MAESENQQNNIENNGLEAGTYEIIQHRLQSQKNDLLDRLSQLNDERKKVFGAVETKLLHNERINTDNNCVARDIIAFNSLCIFGYNVHFGLRQNIQLNDVFSIYEFDGQHFHAKDLTLIHDDQFIIDFENLYKYYRNTIFSKFSVIGNYLYMVFQISENIDDIKTFKWLIESDKLSYIDNRSEHEFTFPEQHEFNWQKTTREMFRDGKHAHVSILDKVFVETIGGDLTIKIEDNTNDGLGIYNEDVNNPDQTLDDGEYFYADLGNLILLKIKPYQEDYRYFIYNNKMQEVLRIDTLKDTGILLPDSQGLLLSNGYYLQTGEYNVFDNTIDGIQFQERIVSPNGEDYLFVFYDKKDGVYLLLMYNVINQSITTPIFCNGYTVFEDGSLCYFKTEEKATKHHVVQIWQTPFTKSDQLPSEFKDHILSKIGNKDIVKVMAECQELIVLLNKKDNYEGLYMDIVKSSKDIIDAYYWLNDEQTYNLNTPLSIINDTANNAIDEYEKVVRIKKETNSSIQLHQKEIETLFNDIKHARFKTINEYVESLSHLRKIRGENIALKELRYAPIEQIDTWENQLEEQTLKLSNNCVQFLSQKDALTPYSERIKVVGNEIDKFSKVVEGKKLEEQLNQIGLDLELLIDIVSNLQIEDSTQSTKIIDEISLLFSQLNQLKALSKKRLKSLGGKEAKAQFASQLKLIDQAIISYIDLSNTPEKCDEYLAKLMVQLEELQGKFADFEEFIDQVAEKRETIYEAFENKKLQLIEAKNKKSIALFNAGERILKSINAKLTQLSSNEEINAYFATDIMIEKLRQTIDQLFQIEESGKADDLSSQLKVAKEDAIRQLKDKQDLFDGQTIKLGNHRFAINTQNIDLTIVSKSGKPFYHIIGTNFYQALNNSLIEENESLWEQEIPSETQHIYRAEFLAYQLFKLYIADKENFNLVEKAKQLAKENYQFGYTKGVHDEDAISIAKVIIEQFESAGNLHFHPTQRILALLWWENLEKPKKSYYTKQIKAAGIIKQVFPDSEDYEYLIEELADLIQTFNDDQQLFEFDLRSSYQKAAQYLIDEFSCNDDWKINASSIKVYKNFTKHLIKNNQVDLFEKSIKETEGVLAKYKLASHWLKAFSKTQKNEHIITEEVCFLLLMGLPKKSNILTFNYKEKITSLIGSHSSFEQGEYHLDYYEFQRKMEKYTLVDLPIFYKFKQSKIDLVESYKKELKLSEFQPKVLSSFVRNQLIDNVYLPLFGDNLAKQIGAVGDNKRTDRQGMLLLISPPGYGKTTLMEYLSNRLGMVFVKINGPAIGHQITSLDPNEAKNEAAKQELKKLNLGLEMGDNIMLYIDDIQHCNPEFLQKFISLSDGQRKIEGVFNNVSKTYDLRGKKICVVMAGNPYTESGEKFTIPDMLANRADIYNLGDIIGDTEDYFKLSLIENAVSSHPILQQLSTKSQKDLASIVQMIEHNSDESIEFEGNYQKDELQEYTAILQKVIKVRETVLKVNKQYILSAAMADENRVEPPFKLQGSYRDMNKLVAKIEAIMNEEELKQLLVSHYNNESQTLTSGAEANMLKFKELNNWLSEEEKIRWEAIKENFVKKNLLKFQGSKQGIAMIEELSKLSGYLSEIKNQLNKKK